MGDRSGILEIAQESSEAAAKLRRAEKAHREPSGETYRAKKAEIQDIKRPAHGTQSSARDNIIEAQKIASNAKLEISELAWNLQKNRWQVQLGLYVYWSLDTS